MALACRGTCPGHRPAWGGNWLAHEDEFGCEAPDRAPTHHGGLHRPAPTRFPEKHPRAAAPAAATPRNSCACQADAACEGRASRSYFGCTGNDPIQSATDPGHPHANRPGPQRARSIADTADASCHRDTPHAAANLGARVQCGLPTQPGASLSLPSAAPGRAGQRTAKSSRHHRGRGGPGAGPGLQRFPAPRPGRSGGGAGLALRTRTSGRQDNRSLGRRSHPLQVRRLIS